MQGKFQVLPVGGQFIRISWNIQTSLIDHHPLLGNLTDFGIHREWNLSTNVKEKYFKWDQTKNVSKYILQSVLPLWQTRFAPCDLCPINNYPKIFPCSWSVGAKGTKTNNKPGHYIMITRKTFHPDPLAPPSGSSVRLLACLAASKQPQQQTYAKGVYFPTLSSSAISGRSHRNTGVEYTTTFVCLCGPQTNKKKIRDLHSGKWPDLG